MSSPAPIPDRNIPETPQRRRQFAVLFMVMLTMAAGNTGLQSVMPVLGRSIGFMDSAVALSFSFSALLWSISAPIWARQLGRRGNRQIILIGMTGYVVSLILCGVALSAGVLGYLAPVAVFIGFVASRMIYGVLGAGAPPAAMAMIAANTSRADRTAALTVLASAFGLGTIVGPALAPFFMLPMIGAAGSPFVFGALTIGMILAVVVVLRDDMPAVDTHGAAQSYPAIGDETSGEVVMTAMSERSATRIGWRDKRLAPWLTAGVIAGHAQAMNGMAIGFLILDRMQLPPAESQHLIGIVLMTGAGATLMTQWALIPRLGLAPRDMILWGSAIAAAGTLFTAMSGTIHAIAVSFALSSLGFGFIRPGFSAGASLAVGASGQGDVAGKVTAVNGSVYVAGPFIAMVMYEWRHALPFEVASLALILLVLFTLRRVRAFPPSA